MKNLFITESVSKNLRKRKRVQISNDEPSLVRPEFQDQQNILNILKRGGIPVPTSQPQFLDNFNLGDKIDTYEKVKSAQAAFMSLPPEIRKHYRDEPQLLISDIENNNRSALESLGIISKPVVNSSLQTSTDTDITKSNE